jgi:FSR family fosmidomycin resistance protein-like MFS transporter
VTGAPSVEHELALSHAAYVVAVFAAPLLVAAALEAGVALASDRLERRRLVVAGQAALAASLFAAAWTRTAWGLAIALAVAGTASGVACGAAQAILVGTDPRGADRAMVRWTLFGAVGDVLAPLVTAAALLLGFSYRGAMAATALLVAAQCAATAYVRDIPQEKPPARAAGDAAVEDRCHDNDLPESAPEPLARALARAARSPLLWVWLLTAALCTLLDELVVALSALRMQREQGAVEAVAAGSAAAFAVGAVVGAALTDRVVDRLGRRAVLVGSALFCALAVGALLASRTPLASCVALFLVGVTCAPHHALAMARAYDQMPRNPGTVQACAQLFVVVDLAAPVALGLTADRFGLDAAIACLLLQPAAVAACAALQK